MEKILLFQVGNTETAEIKRLAESKKIKVKSVPPTQFGYSLKDLEQGNTDKPVREITLPEKSLMLFCHVSEKHFDRLLFEMKSRKIPVDFKAILTSTNQNWAVDRLYMELTFEQNHLLRKK